ncbi:hypothetical protein CAEBREN_22769 [Caenorhabditis brenneri]|uniref:SPK domain-containing protein n=1 Tax=Caenorhabditis brenneri TaxID=135651 RepID=G0NY39_CAEBE|nr:hypothetical protein CAEBREN_22769 [Caenorhabditis brenneri]
MSAIKNPPDFLKKFTENIWLLDWIIVKSQDMTKPITVNEFCRRFRAARVSATSEATIIRRFKTVCYRIHELELDNDTKVRVIFFMSVPVNLQFLEELKQEATVVLNRFNQIIKYSKNDGSLELDATLTPETPETPATPDTSRDDNEDELMEFLAKKAEKSCNPISFSNLEKAFRKASGYEESTYSLQKLLVIFLEERILLTPTFFRFETVKVQIFTADKYDLNTRVKMIFITKTPVTGDELDELRKNAVVEVDGEKIKHYKAYDGSLELPPPVAIVPAAPEVYAMTSSGRRVRQLAPSQAVSTASTPKRPPVSKRSSVQSGKSVSKKAKRSKSDQQDENVSVGDTVDMNEPEQDEAHDEDMFNDDDQRVAPTQQVVFNPSVELHQEEEPSNSTAIDEYDNQTDYLNYPPIPSTNTQSTSSAYRDRSFDIQDFPASMASKFEELKNNEEASMRYTESALTTPVTTESTFSYASTRRNVVVKREMPDDDVICDTTFAPVNNTSALSFTVSNPTMTDSRTYLVKLRALILSIESPLVDDLKRDFNAKLEAFKKKTHRVPISNILCMLNSTYMIALQHSRAPNPDYPKEQFMSLKKFLESLYLHVVVMECHELEAKIAEAKQNAEEGLVVPIDRIRDSLATLIYVATSKL